MGTWGYGITSDDTVMDVLDEITDRIKAGDALESAVAQAEESFFSDNDDPDEEPLLWLAIAHAQWKYGAVEARVLDRVRDDIDEERGLDRWRDSPRDLLKRKAALAKFLAKVASPNPKPSALPKLIIRKAPFREGDCLSVSLPNGLYTAALVLAENNSNPEVGMNLVGTLDYLDQIPPDIRVFERKKWLTLTYKNWEDIRYDPRTRKLTKRRVWRKRVKDIAWYLPVRMKPEMKRFTLVGNVGRVSPMPKADPAYSAWSQLGTEIVRQREQKQRRKPWGLTK